MKEQNLIQVSKLQQTKKLHKTLHIGISQQMKQDTMKDLIMDKLVNEFSEKNQLNIKLIVTYIEDFFINYQRNEGAIRALKEEIKEAVKKSEEEKLLTIIKLNQRIQKKQKEQQLKTIINPINITQSVIPERKLNKTENNSQAKIQNNSVIDEFRRKSIYYGDQEIDEWAAIVKYDTVQFQKEQEQQKKVIFLNKKKIKDELDKQIAEKEQRKQKEKEEDQLYYTANQKYVEDFDRSVEKKKEDMKRKQLEEKLTREKQISIEKRKKKEQVANEKQQDEQTLNEIKEQLKAENDYQVRKRLEQKQKYLQILQQNENLRLKAKEQIKLTQESEKKNQEKLLEMDLIQNEKKEQLKKQREDKIQLLMNNYSQYISKNKNDSIIKVDDYISDIKNKKSNLPYTLFDLEDIQIKKDKQNQIKQELSKQMQERQRRNTQEIEEKKMYNELQQKEQKQLLQLEENRKNKIKQLYLVNQEELKKQMVKGYLSASPKRKQNSFTKMLQPELLQNKTVLKKIANDSTLGISFKKSDISIYDE